MTESSLNFLLAIRIPLDVFIILVVVSLGLFLLVALINAGMDSSSGATPPTKAPTDGNNGEIPPEAVQAFFEGAALELAVHLIRADGEVRDEEIQTVCTIGPNMFEHFDAAKFKSLCKKGGKLKSRKDLAKVIDLSITQEGKKSLLLFLLTIAFADGEMHPKEERFIENLATDWNIDLAAAVAEFAAAE